MTAIDLKRVLKDLYNPPAKEVTYVDVPEMSFLMIDGAGDPNSTPAYQAAVEALYAVAYGLKFMLKRGAQALDYVVMPSEGLWWADDMSEFSVEKKGDWRWTMMIAQPPEVTAELVATAVAEAGRKKNLPALPSMRFADFHEGASAQIMHIGPYAAEAPTVAQLHESIHANGYVRTGRHHEIYLSDPRKTAPEKMKTILRQPIARG